MGRRLISAIEFFKFKSIQSTISLAFLLLVLFTILVIEAISFGLTYDTVEKNSRAYTYQLIEHVRSYLTIQKMRYREKLDFSIEVDPDILEYKTLKILLQPLVQNSIYHGIKNKAGIGMIKILGKKLEHKILL